jgi:hypothetical protein
VLLDQVQTIAANTTGVPVEETFTVSTGGNYLVKLTDLGAALTPSAPLASVSLAVTGGNTVIGTPLSAAGTLPLNGLRAGTYRIHVVGAPGPGLGSGGIGIVVSAAGGAQVAAFNDILALPSQGLPSGEAKFGDSYTVPSALPSCGSYTVSLNDLQLPQPLSAFGLIVLEPGSAAPLITLPSGGSNSGSVSLCPGVTYDVFSYGVVGAGASGGLYSVVLAPSGGAPVLVDTVPVGTTVLAGSPGLAAGKYSFSLSDLQFPAPLGQIGAELVLQGQIVAGPLNAAGSQTFTASVAGTYGAYAAATAAAPPGGGSYALQVTPQGGGAPVFDVAQGVTTAGGNLEAFAFNNVRVPAAAAHTVTLTDFQFPALLPSVSLAAEQHGAVLGSPISRATTLNISPAAGLMSLVVFAQAPASGGLFGVGVAPSAGGVPELDVTQAAGALFYSQQFAITSPGSYSVTATDLGFPAAFSNYDTIITQGASEIGSIYGGGTFDFVGTPGTYYINFIAQPNSTAQAGTYALTVASAPPAPVVNLAADHSQVSSGSTVDLTWSTQNATSCQASGGWSGSKPLSGTITTAALSSDTTFTLTCAGAGGKTAKSLSVSVTASSGGHGGSMDPGLLLALAVALGAALLQRARAATRTERHTSV